MRSLFRRYRREMLHARIYLMLFKAAVDQFDPAFAAGFFSAAIR
jgi:hypothetical protein